MNQLKKQLFYFLSLISLSLPQTLFSHSYAQAKVIFAHQSKKRSIAIAMPNPSYYHSIKFSNQLYNAYYNTSATWYSRTLQNEKVEKIFELYPFYVFSGFREFIKTLPGYKAHIKRVYKKLSKKWKFFSFWEKLCVTNSPLYEKDIIKQLYSEIVQEEEQINQLRNAYQSSKSYEKSQAEYNNLISQRRNALTQSCKNSLQHSLYQSNCVDIDAAFIHKFSLHNCIVGLQGTSIQLALQKEFHGIAQQTAQVWKAYGTNTYVQELVKRNATCIKKGIACNKEGKIIQAAQFADIAWAVLDHVKAIGEGACEGVGNVAHAFCHPIETVQGTARTIYTITASLGKVTIEGIDLCILSVTDPHAAQKKLQTWKQKFTKVAGGIYKQYQETPSRDIAKLISSFGTEMFLTGRAFRALGKLLSFTHTKTSKLVKKLRKTTDSPTLATTPEGLTVQVNRAVKHTESLDKVVKNVDGTSKKIIKKSIDIVNQTNVAVLKNGYYEVNGFKFTKFYYNKLWQNGRGAPSLTAKAILENTTKIIPDPAGYPGFFKYFSDKWEMVYNPTTKIVSHIQPIRNRRI